MNCWWGTPARFMLRPRASSGPTSEMPAHIAIADGEPVSSRLAAVGGQRGTAAVAAPSLPAGADGDTDQEPVGFDRQERGADRFSALVSEAPAGDRGVAADGLVCRAARRSSGIAG